MAKSKAQLAADITSTVTSNGRGTITGAALAGLLQDLIANAAHVDDLLGFVSSSALAGLAPLASPAFTGTPTAPTQTSGDSTTNLATTAFVAAAIAGSSTPGPFVSAYQSTAQTFGGISATKVLYQSERFDTANCFDNTLSRFTPNTAGYYDIRGTVALTSGTTDTALDVSIYKNGVAFVSNKNSIETGQTLQVSDLMYLNGTTDYVEIFVGLTSVSTRIDGAFPSRFSAAFVQR